MSEEQKNVNCGVFWIVEGELMAVLFDEDATEGLSKHGNNYNHRLLWPHVRPKGTNRQFDYYPRGRVERNTKGKAVIFMGTSVDPEFIPEIMEAFGIAEMPHIILDGSYHYMSYEERMNQKRDNRRKMIKKTRKNRL